MTIRCGATFLAVILLTIVLAACGGGARDTAPPPTDPAPSGDLPPGHPPLGGGDASGQLPTPVVEEETALGWTKPEAWIDEPPANAMRQAQYRVPGEAGDGICVVYYFGAGQGGDPQANAERWAGQFVQPDGSSSLDVMKTEQITVNGLETLMVEVTGTYREGGMSMTGAPEQQRSDHMLLGAVVEGPDSNWFFKFTGPEATLRAASAQFEALVKSARGPA
jgi:hypothetical protein